MERSKEPRANVPHVERIGSASYMNLFTYRVDHSLKAVLAEGYFKNYVGFERHDRIEVTCSCDTSKPEHALLVVTDSNPIGGVTVELLRGATEGK